MAHRRRKVAALAVRDGGSAHGEPAGRPATRTTNATRPAAADGKPTAGVAGGGRGDRRPDGPPSRTDRGRASEIPIGKDER